MRRTPLEKRWCFIILGLIWLRYLLEVNVPERQYHDVRSLCLRSLRASSLDEVIDAHDGSIADRYRQRAGALTRASSEEEYCGEKDKRVKKLLHDDAFV